MMRDKTSGYLGRHDFVRILATALSCTIVGFAGAAEAATINIVALGASNTAGKGVQAEQAWPAQLAGMLRANGYDVKMTVVGMLGASSDAILNRVNSSVPTGTQVVLYDTGSDNDRKMGKSQSARDATIAEIEKRIRARGANPVKVVYLDAPCQPDGVHLIAPAGHHPSCNTAAAASDRGRGREALSEPVTSRIPPPDTWVTGGCAIGESSEKVHRARGLMSRLSIAVLLWVAVAGTVSAQTANFVPPPRTIADVTAILDQEKPNPAEVAKLTAAADAEPPAGAKRAELARFYYDRGQARSILGRTVQSVSDAKEALKYGEGSVGSARWACSSNSSACSPMRPAILPRL